MKKLREWWYSYRLIVCLLKGASALLNNAKYNPILNLATAVRNYEWCVQTYPYVNFGPLEWLVRFRLARFKKKIEAFDFAGLRWSDGYDDAMEFYNNHDHMNVHPDMKAAMAAFNESEEGQKLIAENQFPAQVEVHDTSVQAPNWTDAETRQYAQDHAGIMGYPVEEKNDG